MLTETFADSRTDVWNVMIKLENALINKDPFELDELIADDFIGATPTGEAFDKMSYIKHHCIPGFGIMALSGQDMEASNIRLYNDTAVINRRVHSQFKIPNGELLEYDVQRIEVFAKINDEWQLVSGQGTKVIPVNKSVLQ